MGRNVGRHAHSDPRGAVEKQVRHLGGKNHRLLKATVKVWGEIDSVLFDIS